MCGLLPNCVPRLSLTCFSFAVRVLQSSLLAARQAPPDVPTAADLVSAIEKLVKNKLVSGHAGGSSEYLSPPCGSQDLNQGLEPVSHILISRIATAYNGVF